MKAEGKWKGGDTEERKVVMYESASRERTRQTASY